MELKPYHHKNLRETLIETGIRLMNESGYEQLSLRKIASVCGVSHTAPYRHFADKESLLTAMQQHVENQFSQILLQSINNNETAQHPMVEFGKAYVLFFAEHPEYYTFFIRQDSYYVHISPDTQTIESNYRPFLIFQKEAQKHLEEKHVPASLHITALSGMWATVHGLAGMATMSGVRYDGNWSELTEKILMGVSPHE